MFGHPAYNYIKGKSAKSTGGFDQADGSPCKSRESSHHRAQLPDKLIIGLRSKVAPGDMGEGLKGGREGTYQWAMAIELLVEVQGRKTQTSLI